MAVLEISGLMKRREQGGSAFELRIPALSLESGRFYGVVGPSGSGKSTLLDMLALVMRPSEVETFRITSPETGSWRDIAGLWRKDDELGLADIRKSMLGYVLQSGGLIGFLTVRQNLELPFQITGYVADQTRIDDMAGRFGIGDQLDKKPRHLSGGQRQRVAILRALMLQPPLILADEPTAAVDQIRARQIVREFRDLAIEAGCTIVMVSHDLDLVSNVSDHVLELETGDDGAGTALSVARWRSGASAQAGAALEMGTA